MGRRSWILSAIAGMGLLSSLSTACLSDIRTELAIVEAATGLAKAARTAEHTSNLELWMRLFEKERQAQGLERARLARGTQSAGLSVIAPAATLLGRANEIGGTCAGKAPDPILAPAEPNAVLGPSGTSAGVRSDNTGIFFEKIVYRNGTKVCHHQIVATWEDFWDNAESQDVILNTKLNDVSGLPGSGPQRAVIRGAIADTYFIVSKAPSRLNSDAALLIAAARKTRSPESLVWHKFRIQLTHLADGGHFCTPSASASVLNPVIGVLPVGRLFVAFNSFEGVTTTGSILDIDARSLLNGGPAQVKCFIGTELKNLVPPDVRDANNNAYFVGISTLATASRFKLRRRASVADDTLTATPDINIPFFDFNPAAVQPNGFHLYSGGFGFQAPSIQIGESLWNVHQIGDAGGYAKVRLYKFGTTATDPEMALTPSTLPDQSDDLFAPSVDTDSIAPGSEAFMTFTRTIASDATSGKATLIMARGPNSSADGWTFTVLAASKGQFSKNTFGGSCDPFIYAGCNYGPTSATVIDPVNNLVWGFGEIITRGALGIGGEGNEVNWVVKGIGVAR